MSSNNNRDTPPPPYQERHRQQGQLNASPTVNNAQSPVTNPQVTFNVAAGESANATMTSSPTVTVSPSQNTTAQQAPVNQAYVNLPINRPVDGTSHRATERNARQDNRAVGFNDNARDQARQEAAQSQLRPTNLPQPEQRAIGQAALPSSNPQSGVPQQGLPPAGHSAPLYIHPGFHPLGDPSVIFRQSRHPSLANYYVTSGRNPAPYGPITQGRYVPQGNSGPYVSTGSVPWASRTPVGQGIKTEGDDDIFTTTEGRPLNTKLQANEDKENIDPGFAGSEAHIMETSRSPLGELDPNVIDVPSAKRTRRTRQTAPSPESSSSDRLPLNEAATHNTALEYHSEHSLGSTADPSSTPHPNSNPGLFASPPTASDVYIWNVRLDERHETLHNKAQQEAQESWRAADLEWQLMREKALTKKVNSDIVALSNKRKRDVLELQDELDRVKQSLQIAKQEKKTLHRDNYRLRCIIGMQQSAVAAVRQQNEEHLRFIQDQEERIRAPSTWWTGEQLRFVKFNQLHLDNHMLQQEIIELMGVLCSEGKMIKYFEARLRAEVNEHEKNKQQLEERTEECAKLVDDITELEADIARLKKDVSAKTRQVERLNMELKAERKEYAEAVTKLDRRTNAWKYRNKLVEERVKENEQLDSERKASEQKANDLSKKNSMLMKQNADLEMKVKSFEIMLQAPGQTVEEPNEELNEQVTANVTQRKFHPSD